MTIEVFFAQIDSEQMRFQQSISESRWIPCWDKELS